jgi:hypothetical protein
MAIILPGTEGYPGCCDAYNVAYYESDDGSCYVCGDGTTPTFLGGIWVCCPNDAPELCNFASPKPYAVSCDQSPEPDPCDPDDVILVAQLATIPGTIADVLYDQVVNCGDCELPEGSAEETELELVATTGLLTLSEGSTIVGTGCEVRDAAECCDGSAADLACFDVIVSYVDVLVPSATYECKVDPVCQGEPIPCAFGGPTVLLPKNLRLRIQVDPDFLSLLAGESCDPSILGSGRAWNMAVLKPDEAGTGYVLFYPPTDCPTESQSGNVWADHLRQMHGVVAELPGAFYPAFFNPGTSSVVPARSAWGSSFGVSRNDWSEFCPDSPSDCQGLGRLPIIPACPGDGDWTGVGGFGGNAWTYDYRANYFEENLADEGDLDWLRYQETGAIAVPAGDAADYLRLRCAGKTAYLESFWTVACGQEEATSLSPVRFAFQGGFTLTDFFTFRESDTPPDSEPGNYILISSIGWNQNFYDAPAPGMPEFWQVSPFVAMFRHAWLPVSAVLYEP